MRGIVLGLVALCGVLALAVPQGMCPIVDATDGDLFGAWSGGTWVSAEDMWTQVAGGEVYRLYTPTKYLERVRGEKAVYDPDDGPWHSPTVEIPVPVEAAREPVVIAVGGDWDALPRVPVALDPWGMAYRTATRAILNKYGIPTTVPVRIDRLWRVDLDADGVDEVLIAATAPALAAEMTVEPRTGDYSFVMMRKVVRGEVRTVPVAAFFAPRRGFANRWDTVHQYTLDAVLDVNGDGVMEIIVGWRYHEGEGQTIYRLDGAWAGEALTAGIGA